MSCGVHAAPGVLEAFVAFANTQKEFFLQKATHPASGALMREELHAPAAARAVSQVFDDAYEVEVVIVVVMGCEGAHPAKVAPPNTNATDATNTGPRNFVCM